LVRIAPPFLPPHHSDPAARDFQSSDVIECYALNTPQKITNGLCPKATTIL